MSVILESELAERDAEREREKRRLARIRLRDEFAIASLIGLRTRNPRVKDVVEASSKFSTVRTLSSAEVAAMAYADADAMLYARELKHES